MHTYDIELLYLKYKKLDKGEEREELSEEYDGCFKLSDFVIDLSYVTGVFTVYFAFIEFLKGNPKPTCNLFYQEIYFDTLNVFKKYKHTIKYDDYEMEPN